MKDPVGSFLRIRELYMSYLDTAFRIRNEEVAEERRRLLRRRGTLCTDPLLEPIPRYKQSSVFLHELVGDASALPGLDPDARKAFVELVLSGLIPSEAAPPGSTVARRALFRLYTHQVEALRRGVQTGKPAIITSGTGSGKTESFLLPIFAMLANEARGWPASGPDYLKSRWWWDDAGRPYTQWASREPHERVFPSSKRPLQKNVKGLPSDHPIETFVPHRSGEHPKRPKGIRALVLYPMNALVEDQLARLRKALDSDLARSTMDSLFNRNRIFFGRYTSETPVTGFNKHPRVHPHDKEELSRRDGQLRELFEKVREIELAQTAARDYDLERAYQERSAANKDIPKAQWLAEQHDRGRYADARYLFASTDGNELCSRWDMQETPPDILITNVSMLSAMLAREVDAPILDKTREWIRRDDGYFFLVLDELHLQRGAAGTEVAHLIRVLLERLELRDPANRHKLRILASSASLPAQGEYDQSDITKKSLDYLYDMFGVHGMHEAPNAPVPTSPAAWKPAVISGEQDGEEPGAVGPLPAQPFLDFLKESGANEAIESSRPLEPADPRSGAAAWLAVFEAFDVKAHTPGTEPVRKAIEAAARHLAAACWSSAEKRWRATDLEEVAARVFDGKGSLESLRGLLLVRGAEESFEKWFGEKFTPATSFRLHTFFRSVEGLFAPARVSTVPTETQGASQGRGERHVGELSIDRTPRAAGGSAPDAGSARVFELLYCECCGELMFGGLKGPGSSVKSIELLPTEPNLDSLPEQAASQRFEDLNFAKYAVFWPTSGPGHEPFASDEKGAHDSWVPALLDPIAGEVVDVASKPSEAYLKKQFHLGTFTEIPDGWIRGYRFDRAPSADRHGRTARSAGTHVPYSCPACNTDYALRQRPRFSPIRNFRAGFAQTTQLLATELFDALRFGGGSPKLVSFSDSRQEAAKAAFDIERRHHQDVRREVFVRELLNTVDARAALRTRLPEFDAELKRVKQLRDEAESAADAEKTKRLNADVQDLLLRINEAKKEGERDWP